MSIIKHYKKLMYFTFNRFKGNNYRQLKEYFAKVMLIDLEKIVSLDNKKILDVGGANGEFCVFLNNERKCNVVNLDQHVKNNLWNKTVISFANQMPFRENSFDIVICRGVLEHIPKEYQEESIKDMFRVMKKNGVCYLMVPSWYSFNGGHHLKPFHFFPFKIAKFLRELFFRDKIKENTYAGANLYPISINRLFLMVNNIGFKVVKSLDTHLRFHFMTKIKILREFFVPSIVLILTKDK